MQRSIKILHISLSAGQGGGPEHVYQLVSSLPCEIESYVALPNEKPYFNRILAEIGSRRIIEVPHRKIKIGSFIRLLNFVLKNNIDIVHSHGKGAGIYGRMLALLCRRKSVHTFHGIHMQYREPLRTIYALFERVLSLCTDAAVCVSMGERSLVLELGFSSQRKATLIENGVVIPATLAPAVSPGSFSIVHMTRFDSVQKNSEALIKIASELKAMNRLNAFCFFVLGDGGQKSHCMALAKHAGVAQAFRFVGYQSDVRKWLRGEGGVEAVGRACCYLSTSRWEGLPLAVLEAMAEGVPVLASDVVGNRDIVIPGHNGYLFKLDDAHQAAAFCVQLLEDERMRKELAANAFLHVASQYSVKKMAKSTARLYKSLFE